ncbi:MAG: MoaD/ThiS family protein [Gammaproteobacteria bacterium]
MNQPLVHAAVIRVRLFAALADARGWRERELPFAPDMTVQAVWTAVTGEPALPARVLCARNMDYCGADTRVAPGDEIAFFPPVTGGAA